MIRRFQGAHIDPSSAVQTRNDLFLTYFDHGCRPWLLTQLWSKSVFNFFLMMCSCKAQSDDFREPPWALKARSKLGLRPLSQIGAIFHFSKQVTTLYRTLPSLDQLQYFQNVSYLKNLVPTK